LRSFDGVAKFALDSPCSITDDSKGSLGISIACH
jgi:hypothetical protein